MNMPLEINVWDAGLSQIAADDRIRKKLLEYLNKHHQSAAAQDLALLHALARSIASTPPGNRADAAIQWEIAREYVDRFAESDDSEAADGIRTTFVDIMTQAAAHAAPLMRAKSECHRPYECCGLIRGCGPPRPC